MGSSSEIFGRKYCEFIKENKNGASILRRVETIATVKFDTLTGSSLNGATEVIRCEGSKTERQRAKEYLDLLMERESDARWSEAHHLPYQRISFTAHRGRDDSTILHLPSCWPSQPPFVHLEKDFPVFCFLAQSGRPGGAGGEGREGRGAHHDESDSEMEQLLFATPVRVRIKEVLIIGKKRDRHSVALLLMDFVSKWCILQQRYPLSVSDKLLDLPNKQPDAVYTDKILMDSRSVKYFGILCKKRKVIELHSDARMHWIGPSGNCIFLVGTVEERERAKLLVRIMCHMNSWRDKTADPGKLLSCASIMPGELENKLTVSPNLMCCLPLDPAHLKNAFDFVEKFSDDAMLIKLHERPSVVLFASTRQAREDIERQICMKFPALAPPVKPPTSSPRILPHPIDISSIGPPPGLAPPASPKAPTTDTKKPSTEQAKTKPPPKPAAARHKPATTPRGSGKKSGGGRKRGPHINPLWKSDKETLCPPWWDASCIHDERWMPTRGVEEGAGGGGGKEEDREDEVMGLSDGGDEAAKRGSGEGEGAGKVRVRVKNSFDAIVKDEPPIKSEATHKKVGVAIKGSTDMAHPTATKRKGRGAGSLSGAQVANSLNVSPVDSVAMPVVVKKEDTTPQTSRKRRSCDRGDQAPANKAKMVRIVAVKEKPDTGGEGEGTGGGLVGFGKLSREDMCGLLSHEEAPSPLKHLAAQCYQAVEGWMATFFVQSAHQGDGCRSGRCLGSLLLLAALKDAIDSRGGLRDEDMTHEGRRALLRSTFPIKTDIDRMTAAEVKDAVDKQTNGTMDGLLHIEKHHLDGMALGVLHSLPAGERDAWLRNVWESPTTRTQVHLWLSEVVRSKTGAG
ncbi:unnamed protein product [Vitrella brassicaformis CCMP3155]|uniref:Uncharacterized protein n=4 Tax=Vitrella brassicaformis TaxID=1169539 RepID=A0A0G4ER18_VITBC|nr:unnamed protein product [Vitrella brassicaformis CCMP3155]|eukprot:CEL99897.1 unnamed protein product [Vitrella brassicaformis CCMP3155]